MSLFLAAGCGQEDISAAEAPAIDKQEIVFTSGGGEQTVVVTSSGEVSVVPADDWVTANVRAKSGNRTLVVFKAQMNQSPDVRETVAAVEAGNEKLSVRISQEGVELSGGTSGDLASQMNERFGIGWNLGNHFDAFNNGVSGETFWGNPKATRVTFTEVKAKGFSTVRIPVTWLGHIGDAPEYKIEDAWLDRVAEVVGYAESAGLNVIINIHHDGSEGKYWLDVVGASRDEEIHKRVIAQTKAMWTQIAEKFKDKGDFLVFESFNEVHDGKWGWGTNRTDGGKQYKCLNEWNQAFVDAVRAVGGKNADRILGIPSYCTSVDIAIESFVMPKDTAKDRLMLSVHSYDPSEYTLTAKYSEWGHTADASKKVAGDNEAELMRMFEKIHANFISKGVPVYMGEMGCVNRATAREQRFQQYYLSYFAKLAKIYGVPVMLWDNGARGAGNERHAFIDHSTGAYCSTEAEAAVKAFVGSYENGLTLEDIYNGAPKQ